MSNQTNEKQAAGHAPIVEKASSPAETASGDIVALVANRKPTGDGKPDKWHSVTPSRNATPAAWYCAHCGEPFKPGKPWGRFCGSRCRLANWRARQVAINYKRED